MQNSRKKEEVEEEKSRRRCKRSWRRTKKRRRKRRRSKRKRRKRRRRNRRRKRRRRKKRERRSNEGTRTMFTCIPRRAKIIIKRKRRSSKDAMDFMEFSSDATKLRRDAQYLVIWVEDTKAKKHEKQLSTFTYKSCKKWELWEFAIGYSGIALAFGVNSKIFCPQRA